MGGVNFNFIKILILCFSLYKKASEAACFGKKQIKKLQKRRSVYGNSVKII